MEESDLVPRLRRSLAPEGRIVSGLLFSLPEIPGIPDTDTPLVRAFRLAADSTAFADIPRPEIESVLSSLVETTGRAAYHKARFDSCLEQVKLRRVALGGPVVGDWHAVPALAREFIAYLGGVRTAIDIIVYIAARRAGKSESSAAGWAAKDAILPECRAGHTPPTRYDVPEVLAIRAHNPWFEEVNLFRNGAYHRGWKEDYCGFYSAGDCAEEASDPEFNAMMLPDIDCLRAKAFPYKWTFSEGRRLDSMIECCDSVFSDVCTQIVTEIWRVAIPAPGTSPKNELPNTLLFLPSPVVLAIGPARVIPVFDTRSAARVFRGYEGFDKELAVRAVRPTRIADGTSSFLLPIGRDDALVTHEVQLHTLSDGVATCVQSVPIDPERDGPMMGVVRFRVLGDTKGVLYVLQEARGCGNVEGSEPSDEDR